MVCLVNRKYLNTDCVNYEQRIMLVIGTILIYQIALLLNTRRDVPVERLRAGFGFYACTSFT